MSLRNGSAKRDEHVVLLGISPGTSIAMRSGWDWYHFVVLDGLTGQCSMRHRRPSGLTQSTRVQVFGCRVDSDASGRAIGPIVELGRIVLGRATLVLDLDSREIRRLPPSEELRVG
jgi:hypothetical protein